MFYIISAVSLKCHRMFIHQPPLIVLSAYNYTRCQSKYRFSCIVRRKWEEFLFLSRLIVSAHWDHESTQKLKKTSYHHCQCPSVWRSYLSFSLVLTRPRASSLLRTPSYILPTKAGGERLPFCAFQFQFVVRVKLSGDDEKQLSPTRWQLGGI